MFPWELKREVVHEKKISLWNCGMLLKVMNKLAVILMNKERQWVCFGFPHKCTVLACQIQYVKKRQN